MNHKCAAARPHGVFCSTCGRVVDRDGLKTIGRSMQSFTGPASLNPNVEKFWESGGDASVFEKR